jgi:hypothetical protein
MKNRYILLLIAIFATSAQLNAISPSNMAKAARIAFEECRTYAFKQRGPISVKQKYGFFADLARSFRGKDSGTWKQHAIDKLHTKKNFWMAYSAITTLGYAYMMNCNQDLLCFVLQTTENTMKTIRSPQIYYDGTNPFAAAEKAADDAALL